MRSTDLQHAENEKKLDSLSNRVSVDHSEMEKLVSMLDNKIAKEVASLLATYERYRNDVIKYAGGKFLFCLYPFFLSIWCLVLIHNIVII